MIHKRIDQRIDDASSFFDKKMISTVKIPETHQYVSDNSRADKYLKNFLEERQMQSNRSNVKIGSHEVTPINMLLSLEKKPVESYFEGIKRKPIGRKKIRQPKKTSLNFWEVSPVPCKEGWISTLGKAPLKEMEENAGEDRLLGKMIEMRVRNYEQMEKHKQEKISRRQRLAEKKYLEQQANLAETWLGVMERRIQLRNENSIDFAHYRRPTFERHPPGIHYNRIDISILSREFWSDDEGKEPRKSQSEKKSIVDDLEEDFSEKLVFVDVEE